MQHLLYLKWVSHPPPPDHTSGEKAQKSSGELCRAKREGTGMALRQACLGKADSYLKALQPLPPRHPSSGWGPEGGPGAALPAPTFPAPHPASALPPRPAPGMGLRHSHRQRRSGALLIHLKTSTGVSSYLTHCVSPGKALAQRPGEVTAAAPADREASPQPRSVTRPPGIWGPCRPEA